MQRNMTWLVAGLVLALSAASNGQDDPIWTYRFAGQGSGTDQPLASVVDDTGNVYVAGWTEGTTSGIDVLLLKLDSQGREVWVRTYDYGANEDDEAVGAVRDASGNIYIAAGVADTSRGRVALLKYNPGGDLLWMRSYGETNRDYAAAGGVALDASQNVYVGVGTHSTSSPTMRVLKYDPNGNLAWTKSYTAVGYDHVWTGRFHPLPSGGVYLALGAEHPQRRDDWLIVRLSPQGQVQWEKVYKETGNLFEALRWSQVDEQENIYLTGIDIPSAVRNAVFCTMKIDSSGNILWVKEYDEPQSERDEPEYLLLDRGSTYVAGRSIFDLQVGGELPAMTLVKYDSLGNEMWARRYASGDTSCEPGSLEDIFDGPPFCSINAGDAGNVYLAGTAFVTRSGSGAHAVALKHDSLGERVWVRTYARQGWSCHGAIVEVDDMGAVYSIGTEGQAGQCDIFVVKYRGR